MSGCASSWWQVICSGLRGRGEVSSACDESAPRNSHGTSRPDVVQLDGDTTRRSTAKVELLRAE